MNPQENSHLAGIKRFDSNLFDTLYQIKVEAEKQLKVLARKLPTENSALLVEKTQRALDGTLKQATRVMEMIQHFRTSNQETAAQASGLAGEVSIGDCVNEVVRAMTYEFPFRGITLLKIIPHDLPSLMIDYGHFESILFQLLHNAQLSLSGRFGIITIEASKCEPDKGADAAGVIHLRVSDTGQMIPEESLKKIFDPFFSSKKIRMNAGLSLYWVKKLVEINGGHISVRSDMNGTTFELDFPIHRSAESRPAA